MTKDQRQPSYACRDKYTSRPRGFGFLTLTDEDAAAQICQDTHTLDGRQVCCSPRRHSHIPRLGFRPLLVRQLRTEACLPVQIDAKRSLPQSQKPKLRKLFVGGLAPETTEGTLRWPTCTVHTLHAPVHVGISAADGTCAADDFREYFGQFGDITEAQIMQDHTSGRSRGFG